MRGESNHSSLLSRKSKKTLLVNEAEFYKYFRKIILIFHALTNTEDERVFANSLHESRLALLQNPGGDTES